MPQTNLALGGKIVSDLYQRYGGDSDAVAVAYNAEPDRADKWLAAGRDNSVLPSETRQYVTNLHKQLGGTQYAQNFAPGATFSDVGPTYTEPVAPRVPPRRCCLTCR